MTLSELVTAVAEEIGIIGAGQPVANEDDAMVKRRYERVRQIYNHRGYMHWAAADDIPDEAALGVTMLTAHSCLKPFGMPLDPQLRSDGERSLALYRERHYPRKTLKFKAY